MISTSRRMDSKWLEKSNLNLGIKTSTDKSCISHMYRVNTKGLILSMSSSIPFIMRGNNKYIANCP